MSHFAGDRPDLGMKKFNTMDPIQPGNVKSLHKIQDPGSSNRLFIPPGRKKPLKQINNKENSPEYLPRLIPLRSQMESNSSPISDLSLFRDQWDPKAFQSHLLDMQSNSTPDRPVKKKINIDRSMVLCPNEKLPIIHNK